MLGCFSDMEFFSEHDIQAIVSPSNINLRLAAERYAIPYIATSFGDTHSDHSEYMFHILPRPINIAELIQNLIISYDWRTVALIYDNSLGKAQIL